METTKIQFSRREILTLGATIAVTTGILGAGKALAGEPAATPNAVGPFKLPELPYPKDALAPHISAETLHYHHDKHHAGYVKKLNELVAGTKYASMPLEEVVTASREGTIFNNAAQHWNHSFYWNCMSPRGGGKPTGDLVNRIRKDFGDVQAFKKQFADAAVGQFGSGWAWLVKKPDGSLAIEKTHDADTPIARGGHPLLTCDVWEHAYYIDYRNERAKYVDGFWQVINWEFVAQNDAKG